MLRYKTSQLFFKNNMGYDICLWFSNTITCFAIDFLYMKIVFAARHNITYIFKYSIRNIMSEPYLLAINLSIKVNNKTVCGAENCFIWFIITYKSCVP